MIITNRLMPPLMPGFPKWNCTDELAYLERCYTASLTDLINLRRVMREKPS